MSWWNKKTHPLMELTPKPSLGLKKTIAYKKKLKRRKKSK
jgi:hypothetical protein|tara:strand:+ start:61 stop:180 length:120 start_codon:yes stop_codon:yes gene_type:complete